MARKVKCESIPVNHDLRFDSAVEAFISQRRIRGLTDKSIRFYVDVFNYVRKQGFPEYVSAVTPEYLESFIAQLLEHGMKPVTVNGKMRGLKALFNFLHDRQYITTNPIESIQFIKHDKHIIRTFEAAHVKALLNECADGTFAGLRERVVILLLLETGMRAGELLNLRLTDLDINAGTAVVMGKGRKPRRVFFGDKTANALRLYLTERGSLPHEYLIVNEDNQPLKLRSLQDRISDLGKRAGIKGVRCSLHTFRHTAAKVWIQNGGDIFTLQKLLGHSSLDMVRNYVEMFSNDVAEAHSRFSPVKLLDN